MKKLQGSTIAKVCAVIVLLCAAFAAGIFGIKTLMTISDVTVDHWQNTRRYHTIMADRRTELMNGVELMIHLGTLEKQIETGEAGPLAYVDLEALQEELEELEKRFSRDETWFRFRILTADSREVLGTNLEDGESLAKTVWNVDYNTYEVSIDPSSSLESYAWSVYGDDEDSPLFVEILPGDSTDGENPEKISLILECGVPENVRDFIQDEFYQARCTYENNRTAFDENLAGFLNLAALTFIALVWILWTAGHKSGTEGITVTWQERIFFDLYAGAVAALEVLLLFTAIWVAEDMHYWFDQNFYTETSAYQAYLVMAEAGFGALCTYAVAAGSPDA